MFTIQNESLILHSGMNGGVIPFYLSKINFLGNKMLIPWAYYFPCKDERCFHGKSCRFPFKYVVYTWTKCFMSQVYHVSTT